MKNADVTKSVMENVVSFESRRTRKWIGIFLLIILVILGLIIAVATHIYGTLSERHTLDVLEIIFQDREIISEFWQDTLFIAWEEFPRRSFYIVLALVAVFAAVWAVTKKSRKIIARRVEELAKRKKRRNNT